MLTENEHWPSDLPTLDSTATHIEAIMGACCGERPIVEVAL
jgi:hypothetical protein